MEIYTYQQWGEDRTLSVKVGQLIDNEVFDDLLCSLPPKTWTDKIFQPGEPESIDWDTGMDLYRTFEKQDCGLYKYIGLMIAQ